MLNFQIQSDSDIPASKQLFAQIQFAIASGQYTPGHRLPSTRQLAMITGLHRNTISKVYQQLEESGLVESVAGSGIYVKVHERESFLASDSPLVAASNLIKDSIDKLLELGCTLDNTKELFLEEINWRLRCREEILVVVPQRDISAGEIMQQELKQALQIPIELVELEQLPVLLEKINFGTIVTSRYFLQEVMEIVPHNSFRVIPIDIYDYGRELEMIKKLPSQACLGIVSLSKGTLNIAESIVNSLRGDDLLVITATVNDLKRLQAVFRSAHTIVSDPSSYDRVKETLIAMREDLIRIPEIIRSDNYIGEKSIALLRRELGLTDNK
ncbi:GntR family transcriptional regulator [Myxosarcina sp. GI1]|uniref:GntR family transcriptional regulator n=1 Tax=Myxosarcina sp. GI1 TaxID=1541065 RepID=UPI00056D8508|nr:GntR family transcriptional regulator [Myxosarcina sp. GI1]